MDKIIIKAEPRTPKGSRENRRQRDAGMLPATINIKGQDSVSVLLKAADLKSALQKHGRAAVLQLDVDNKPYNVMVRYLETKPHTEHYLNAVFQQVSMSEEIKVNVAISLKNTDAISMKQLTLSQQMDALPVLGLATDIPNAIEIDVSAMENGDSFFVKDLVLPKGITVELDPEQLLCSVSMPRVYSEPDTAETEDGQESQEVQEEQSSE